MADYYWKKREKSGGLPRGRAPPKFAFNYSKSPSCSVGWPLTWGGGWVPRTPAAIWTAQRPV